MKHDLNNMDREIKEALNRELMKHDLNNMDPEIFHEIVLSVLNAHSPLKKKHLSKSCHLRNRRILKSSYEESKAKERLLKKRTEATNAT